MLSRNVERGLVGQLADPTAKAQSAIRLRENRIKGRERVCAVKVTEQHVAALKELIEPVDTDDVREKYRKGEFPRADAVEDLDVRYRWDLFHAVKGYSAFGDDHGYNSDHIDTALRSIVTPL